MDCKCIFFIIIIFTNTLYYILLKIFLPNIFNQNQFFNIGWNETLIIFGYSINTFPRYLLFNFLNCIEKTYVYLRFFFFWVFLFC